MSLNETRVKLPNRKGYLNFQAYPAICANGEEKLNAGLMISNKKVSQLWWNSKDWVSAIVYGKYPTAMYSVYLSPKLKTIE